MVKTMRVLVCDDDVACRRALVDLLLSDGMQTYEAGGGFEAIQVARAFPVDFGFFDCELPDLDGPTTLMRLREESLAFPYVLMSGGDAFAEVATGTAGQVAFLQKPLDVVVVREILRDVSGTIPPESFFRRGR